MFFFLTLPLCSLVVQNPRKMFSDDYGDEFRADVGSVSRDLILRCAQYRADVVKEMMRAN